MPLGSKKIMRLYPKNELELEFPVFCIENMGDIIFIEIKFRKRSRKFTKDTCQNFRIV